MQVIGDGDEIAAPDPRAEFLSVARVDQHLAQIMWCGAAPGLDAHDTVGTGGRQVNTQHRPYIACDRRDDGRNGGVLARAAPSCEQLWIERRVDLLVEDEEASGDSKEGEAKIGRAHV